MNKAELTARLEAIDKELLPLFEKKGRTAEECSRVSSLEAEYDSTKAELGRMNILDRIKAKRAA